jgi:serpin B
MARLLPELPIDENVVCSPLSVRLALAMLLPGARGDTREQLAGFLGTDDPAAVADLFRTLQTQRLGVTGRARSIRLSVANGAFLQPRFPVLRAYQEAIEGSFEARIENLDFSDAGAAAARINEWVGKATDGMISNLLSPGVLAQVTSLVVVNAIYFFAEWENPFEERLTRPERFHPLEGAAYDVPMMRQALLLPYAVDDESGIEAVRIPYRATSLVVVLPRRGRFPAVAQSFGEDHVARLRFSEREVELRLPRFEQESRLSLAGVLSRLGVRVPFDLNRADLGALTDHPDGLFVGGVEHAARIRVDEQGTEAAATALMMVTGREPLDLLPFHVNRPFLFFVYDHERDCVLFAGRCPMPKTLDAAPGAGARKTSRSGVRDLVARLLPGSRRR